MTDFIPMYDLESLNEQQRQDYIRNVCKHLGVPDNLNLVALTYIDDGDGPSRLVPYAKRGATENVRNNLQIDVTSLTNQMIGGSIVFTATATSRVTKRQEISAGSKFIDGLIGTALDDAIMAAQTRALRRVTLQFIGAGVLDESEVNQRKLVHTVSSPVAVTPQPTVAPASEPGKDITLIGPSDDPKTQAQVAAVIAIREMRKEIAELVESPRVAEPTVSSIDESKRSEVIAQLNAQTEEPKVKKTRKKRSTVDLGPSEVPAASQAAPEPVAPPVQQAVPAPTAVPPPQPKAAPITAPPAQKQPKTPPDLQKVFRGRLFRLRNDYLDPKDGRTGLQNRDGMGIAAQMRGLAQIMFSGIDDMNDLNPEQWETYLSTLENKIQSEGAAATVKFIEETVGI